MKNLDIWTITRKGMLLWDQVLHWKLENLVLLSANHKQYKCKLLVCSVPPFISNEVLISLTIKGPNLRSNWRKKNETKWLAKVTSEKRVWLTIVKIPSSLWLSNAIKIYRHSFVFRSGFCVSTWSHYIGFYLLASHFLYPRVTGYAYIVVFFLCKQGITFLLEIHTKKKSIFTGVFYCVFYFWIKIKVIHSIMFLLFVVTIRNLHVKLHAKYFKYPPSTCILILFVLLGFSLKYFFHTIFYFLSHL